MDSTVQIIIPIQRSLHTHARGESRTSENDPGPRWMDHLMAWPADGDEVRVHKYLHAIACPGGTGCTLGIWEPVYLGT